MTANAKAKCDVKKKDGDAENGGDITPYKIGESNCGARKLRRA